MEHNVQKVLIFGSCIASILNSQVLKHKELGGLPVSETVRCSRMQATLILV